MQHPKYLREKQFSENPLGKVVIDGDVLHFILGIVEEYNELKDARVKDALVSKTETIHSIDELGDLYWFISSLIVHLDGIFDPDIRPNHTVPNWFYDVQQMGIEVALIVKYLKKYLAYGDDFKSVEIVDCCKRMLAYMHDCCLCLDVTPYQVMQKNIYKLKLRYGLHFTPDKALNKDDVRELAFIKKLKVRKGTTGRPSKKQLEELKAFAEGDGVPEVLPYKRKKRRKRKPGPKKGLSVKKKMPKRRVGRPTKIEQWNRRLLEEKVRARVELMRQRRKEKREKKKVVVNETENTQ